MFENESKRMRLSPKSVQESEVLQSSNEKIDSRERKERHSDRFDLADKLIEIEDFQDHFLKVCIESNTPDKTATTFWNMICIALFRGNFITSLLQIDCYKNMLRNFKSHKNGLPLVKVDARFVDENKNNLTTVPCASKIVRKGKLSPLCLKIVRKGQLFPLCLKIVRKGQLSPCASK